MHTRRTLLVVTAICMLLFSSTASASSSVVSDPIGDATVGSPAYTDIVQSKVTAPPGQDAITFSTELAAALPKDPPDSFLALNWFIDSGGTPAFDYVVVVRFCTASTSPQCGVGPNPTLPRWEAFVNDFVHPVTYISSFKIDGAVVKAFVDPALIGAPSSFRWQSLTRTRPASFGAPRDFAPETCCTSFDR